MDFTCSLSGISIYIVGWLFPFNIIYYLLFLALWYMLYSHAVLTKFFKLVSYYNA